MIFQLWIILAILSAFTASLKNILSKKILSKYDLSPEQTVFERELLTIFILLLLFLPFIDFSKFYELLPIFILKGILVTILSILFFHSLKKYEISVVIPLMNLSPLVLVILSYIILAEILTLVQLLGICILIFGTYILEITHSNHEKKKPHHFHFKNIFSKEYSFFIIIASILFLASINMIIEKILFNQGTNVITNLYFTGLIVFINISMYFIYKKRFVKSLKNIVKEPHTLTIGVLGLIDKGVILSAIAQPAALVSLVIPIRRLETLFSAIIGGMLFHEQHLKQKLIACIIMLVGVLCITIL